MLHGIQRQYPQIVAVLLRLLFVLPTLKRAVFEFCAGLFPRLTSRERVFVGLELRPKMFICSDALDFPCLQSRR